MEFFAIAIFGGIIWFVWSKVQKKKGKQQWHIINTEKGLKAGVYHLLREMLRRKNVEVHTSIAAGKAKLNLQVINVAYSPSKLERKGKRMKKHLEKKGHQYKRLLNPSTNKQWSKAKGPKFIGV